MKPENHMASSPDQIQAARQLPPDVRLPGRPAPMSRGALVFWSALTGAIAALLVLHGLACLLTP